jgi:hypothetical protein
MKSFLSALVLLLLFGPIATSAAQTNLSVAIDDPVYQVLDIGVLKGVIPQQSAVRPYARSRVVELLEALWNARDRFSMVEQEVLLSTRLRFTEDKSGIENGNLTFKSDQSDAQILQAGVDGRARIRMDAGSPEEWHLESVIRPYVQGDLSPWLSYLGILGLTVDRVRGDQVFAPYSFTKEWDTVHFSISDPRYSEGDLDHPSVSYVLETDVSARLLNGALSLELAKHRREWGIGDGSLTLSGTARPFMGVETHVELSPWLIGHQVLGTLTNWAEEPGGINAGLGTISYQKLFALQRLELFPFDWLSLSASGSVVGARRFELLYMAPIYGALAQNLIADLDNVGMSFDAALTLPPYGRAYISAYADELGISGLKDFFRQPRIIFAVQGGIKVPVPGLPFTSLSAQYTKIEPFAYTHYPTDYPDFRIPVDTSYTDDGENLAYPLWPNSDELLVKLSSMPVPGVRASLAYRSIRHGDNPGASPGDPYILGRPDGYYDYSVPDSTYPLKDFLKDGLYDHNHVVTLAGEYSIPGTRLTIEASYTFCYTYWEPNASGEPDRPDAVRNIFGIEVKAFR